MATTTETGYRRKQCEFCDGHGTLSSTVGGDGYGGRCCAEMDYERECSECDGTGFWDRECDECHGSGEASSTEVRCHRCRGNGYVSIEDDGGPTYTEGDAIDDQVHADLEARAWDVPMED